MAVHNILSPIIEIPGDTAPATGTCLDLYVLKGNQAAWGAATYYDRDARESGAGSFNTRASVAPLDIGRGRLGRMRFMQRRNAKIGRPPFEAADATAGEAGAPTQFKGRLLVGRLLLVLGPRLYWLFVAASASRTGRSSPAPAARASETVIVIVALMLALVGALAAVVATKSSSV